MNIIYYNLNYVRFQSQVYKNESQSQSQVFCKFDFIPKLNPIFLLNTSLKKSFGIKSKKYPHFEKLLLQKGPLILLFQNPKIVQNKGSVPFILYKIIGTYYAFRIVNMKSIISNKKRLKIDHQIFFCLLGFIKKRKIF